MMTITRRSSIICLLLAAVILLSGCGPQNRLEYQKYGSAGLRHIGLVLGSPGQADPGSNEALAAGLQSAVQSLDFDYKILAPKDLVNDRESLSYLADNNYDMVVGVGSGMVRDMAYAAEEFPDIKFVMFNGEVDAPNVTSVIIQSDDGAFLAGVEAALLTTTNLVGYIGDPVTAVNSVENSFARGVQYVNSTEGRQVKVNISYIGPTDKTAKAAQMAKNLADNFYMSGVDVIFSAATNVNQGVLNSAIQNKRMSICDDVRLMNSAPWNIFGAIEKKPDAVIYDLAQQMLDDKLSTGRQSFGLAQGAVDFVPSLAVPEDISAKIETLKAQLKDGQIQPYTIIVPEDVLIRVKLDPPAEGTSGQPGITTEKNTSSPAGTQRGSNTGTSQPDAGTSQPDAGTSQPDAGTGQPDAGTGQQ